MIQLFRGRPLALVPLEVRLDGESLRAWLELHRVDVFDCTPAQLRLGILEQPLLAHLLPLRAPGYEVDIGAVLFEAVIEDFTAV